jgi:hypothetical protein
MIRFLLLKGIRLTIDIIPLSEKMARLIKLSGGAENSETFADLDGALRQEHGLQDLMSNGQSSRQSRTFFTSDL